MIRSLIIACLCGSAGWAGSVEPAVPIRAGTIIDASHLILSDKEVVGGMSDFRDAIGLEARVNLYPNRPLKPEQLGAPTLVHRNAPVELIFRSGVLRISVEGRALARGGAGESIRVMNTSSRAMLFGIVVGPNQVEVSQ